MSVPSATRIRQALCSINIVRQMGRKFSNRSNTTFIPKLYVCIYICIYIYTHVHGSVKFSVFTA
jgi:hypothetical protein